MDLESPRPDQRVDELIKRSGSYELREPAAAYKGINPENGVLRLENTYFWNDRP